MSDLPFYTKYRVEILLAGILILAGFLNIWNLWNQGISNAYYAAAVRSMLENPSLIFFNSFDAAGFVTVDKPPVGLWVQIASATILGYSGWTLVLPQALAGVGSVALIYAIVSRPFGKMAGLISALVLAITPIFVAVSRNGTMDGLLIFVILLAIWVALKAARENSLPFLLLSVVLIGIGFNIKMIQAFIVVPAVIAIYLLGAKETPLKKRALHLALAIVLLIGVSLSWAVAVDTIPQDQRPYIGGSGDNTVLGLIVNYNGIHRLENGMISQQGGMPGVQPFGDGGLPASDGGSATSMAISKNRTGNQHPDQDGKSMGIDGLSGNPGSTSRSPGGNSGSMMGETGSPGIFRLFGEGLAGQISWLLAFALIGLLAWWRHPKVISLKGFEDVGLSGDRGLTLLGMSLWLLPGLLYFSFTTGFWHTYYLATIAPPIAALVGIGAVGMYQAYLGERIQSWLLVAAVPITGLIQVIFLMYTFEWSAALIPPILFGTIAVTILLIYLKLCRGTTSDHLPAIVAFFSVALLLVAPFVWACTPLVYGNSNILPVAGPNLSGPGGGMDGGNNLQDSGDGLSQLGEYLISHNTGETWIVAVPSSNNEGSNLIIETGKPVMALGGFGGSDSIVSVTQLTRLINDGKIRYFLTSSSSGDRVASGNQELYTWISGHCAAVPASDWGGSSNTVTDKRVTPVGLNPTSARQGFMDMPFDLGDNNPTMPMNQDYVGDVGFNSIGPGNPTTLYDCAGYTSQVTV